MKPVNGQRYRYSAKGEIRTHRGLIGVASQVANLTAITYSCTLSNVKEWGDMGIPTQITMLDGELEPITEEPVTTPANPTIAPDDLGFYGAESELVATITKALQHQGYLICVVGQLHAKGSGTTVGYPDMSVRRRAWPDGMACLLEVKTATGDLSGEQEDLLKLGWSYVVRSVAGALLALTRFESAVFGENL